MNDNLLSAAMRAQVTRDCAWSEMRRRGLLHEDVPLVDDFSDLDDEELLETADRLQCDWKEAILAAKSLRFVGGPLDGDFVIFQTDPPAMLMVTAPPEAGEVLPRPQRVHQYDLEDETVEEWFYTYTYKGSRE